MCLHAAVVYLADFKMETMTLVMTPMRKVDMLFSFELKDNHMWLLSVKIGFNLGRLVGNLFALISRLNSGRK